MVPLTHQELTVLRELRRLASLHDHLTGKVLRDNSFAVFIMQVFNADVGYPQSLQSRVLQKLRDKGYLIMERCNGGTYMVLDHHVVPVSLIA